MIIPDVNKQTHLSISCAMILRVPWFQSDVNKIIQIDTAATNGIVSIYATIMMEIIVAWKMLLLNNI